MAVIVYRSTDTSAPVLTGETSKLIDLLYACLVTGYGAKAAAGWTREYLDGTNKTAVFRPAAGSRFYLRVSDNGPGAGTFKEARAVGYETMSSADAGTNPFPAVAQMANGAFIRKSNTADATARAWMLVASGKLMHLFVYTGDTANVSVAFSFGDLYSYKPGDTYHCHISGRATENAGGTTGNTVSRLSTTPTEVQVGHYVARSYTGIGGSVSVGQHSDYWLSNQAYTGYGGMGYPDPVDGGMRMTPIYVHDSGSTVRGELPGLWNSMHSMAFTAGDTISGVGGLSGRVFEVVAILADYTCQILVETSDTWTEN